MEVSNPLVAIDPVDQVAKERKIVIVVAPELGVGMAANRCAVLATGIAARHPEILGSAPRTADSHDLAAFTKVPISILAARDLESLKALEEKARSLDCSTFVYLSRAQGVRSYEAYLESIAETAFTDLDIDAIGLYGSRKVVSSLTGNLPALR